MTEPLDAAYEALDDCLDRLDTRLGVGDLSQTDKIWICRSILNAIRALKGHPVNLPSGIAVDSPTSIQHDKSGYTP